MKIINLDQDPITLRDVIELARQHPVSIVTNEGDEVYVTHLGRQGSAPSQNTKRAVQGTITQKELEEEIEDELARLDARLRCDDE